MTMHLDRGLSLTRTRAPKQKKMTVRDYNRLVEEHRAHNKRMKQSNNRHLMMSFDEYRNFKCPTITKRALAKESRNHREAKPFRRDGARRTESIPSVGIGAGNALAKEKKEYTGTLVTGICTMHKSNAVPVINQEQARDISRMRRG